MSKTTLVLGASVNPERASYQAVVKLKKNHHPVYAVGIKEGEIEGEKIVTGKPIFNDVDTVTLYVGPANQREWKDYVYQIHPKRLVFNPGTENKEFFDEATKKGIECVEVCTLVMLSIGNF